VQLVEEWLPLKHNFCPKPDRPHEFKSQEKEIVNFYIGPIAGKKKKDFKV